VSPPAHPVRRLAPTDLPAAAATLADAMVADPFYRWLAPDDARCAAFTGALMARLLRLLGRQGHVYGIGEAGREGVIGLSPPEGFPWPTLPSLGIALGTALTRPSRRPPLGRLLRGARVMTRLDHAHPDAPHWYVAIAGVAPDAQGRGHGRALLDHALALAAADGVPCHLETTNLANVPFYRHLGFALVGEVTVAPAPAAWIMTAPAR
jgi:ribosomal protein S18 acetylase RimI-like enzyme